MPTFIAHPHVVSPAAGNMLPCSLRQDLLMCLLKSKHISFLPLDFTGNFAMEILG